MKKTAHIAFLCTPIASLLNPVLPVVSTLARRGHRVTFTASDTFSSRVEALGVETVKYRFGTMTSDRAREEYSYCRLALNMMASIMPFYQENPPDLVVYDLVALAGPILAQKWRVPRIRLSPLYAFTSQTLERQIEDPQRRTIALQSYPKIDEFLQQHGVPSREYLFHRERLNIFMMPPDFDPCPALEDETCLYAGRCAGEQQPFGTWRPPSDNSRPIVLVAASKSHIRGLDHFRMCIDALSGLNWHVVLSIDDGADPAGLHPLPEHFEIVQRTSHTRILPHASLVLSMGGLTTANEAAYYGVPGVITTLGINEQEWLGGNLDRLNIGAHVRGAEVSPSVLRKAAIDVFSSDLIRANVKQLQYRVRRSPGAEETANRIEEILSL